MYLMDDQAKHYAHELTRRATPDVLAKRDAAFAWCRRATAHAATHAGKPWAYALIPHDAIAENWALPDLLRRWTVAP